jgi:hypothetical protein
MILHYYHAYLIGKYRDVIARHIDLLEDSGLAQHLDRPLQLGLVGPAYLRQQTFEYCAERIPTEVVAETDEGWEQVTLNVLHTDVNVLRRDDSVLYAHTKGVTNDRCDQWRENITRGVVTNWRECVYQLDEHEAVGCYWLPKTVGPFFAGNFWWARAGLLQRMGPPGNGYRMQAESWMNTASPDVYDVAAGWPLVFYDGQPPEQRSVWL